MATLSTTMESFFTSFPIKHALSDLIRSPLCCHCGPVRFTQKWSFGALIKLKCLIASVINSNYHWLVLIELVSCGRSWPFSTSLYSKMYSCHSQVPVPNGVQQLQQEGPDRQLWERSGDVSVQHAGDQGALRRTEVWQRLRGGGRGVRLWRTRGESARHGNKMFQPPDVLFFSFASFCHIWDPVLYRKSQLITVSTFEKLTECICVCLCVFVEGGGGLCSIWSAGL